MNNNTIKSPVWLSGNAGSSNPKKLAIVFIDGNNLYHNLKTIVKPSEIDFKKLNTLEEIMLVKGLAAFPERLIEAAKTYEPSVIAKYLLELSSLFNIFYNKDFFSKKLPR